MKAERFKVSEGAHGPIWKIAKGVRVYKSPDSSYEIEVPERGGKRQRRRVPSLEKAIEAAELFALRSGLELYLVHPEQELHKAYTFEDASRDWYSIHPDWSDSTKERYRGLLDKHILPVIGGYPMALPYVEWREKTKRFLADMRVTQSPKSVEVAHCVIHGVFSESEDAGRIKQNPAGGLLRRILPPKKKRNLTKPDPFSKQDLERVLKSAWQVLPSNLAMAIEVMAMTGMRIGECLAFHIEHLDITHCQYDIKQKIRHGKYGLPKSGEERLIDIGESLVAKLQGHIRGLREELFKDGKQVEYLFPGMTERTLQGALKRSCKAAKLRTRTPHDLRHTYATLLLMDHYSPNYVKKQLGHSSISITVDIYGHWIPGEGRKDLDETLRMKSKK